jgi:hypothetical protein
MKPHLLCPFRLLLLLLSSVSAHAAPGPEDLAEFKRADERLAVLVAEAETADKPALLKTAEVVELVAVLSDEARILGDAPVPVGEITSKFEICGATSRAITSLMVFDVRMPSATPGEMMLTEQSARNLIFFQAELKELQPFLFRCLAKLMPALSEFATSLSPEQFDGTRREGLAQMRRGVLTSFSAAQMMTVDDKNIDESYRLAVLAVLSETASAYAAVSRPSDRKTIATQAEAAANTASEPYAGHLKAIARAFSVDACVGLCAIE